MRLSMGGGELGVASNRSGCAQISSSSLSGWLSGGLSWGSRLPPRPPPCPCEPRSAGLQINSSLRAITQVPVTSFSQRLTNEQLSPSTSAVQASNASGGGPRRPPRSPLPLPESSGSACAAPIISRVASTDMPAIIAGMGDVFLDRARNMGGLLCLPVEFHDRHQLRTGHADNVETL